MCRTTALFIFLSIVPLARAQPQIPPVLPPCATTILANCTPQVNSSGLYVPATGGGGGGGGGGISALTGDVIASGTGSVPATVLRVNGVSYPSLPTVNSIPLISSPGNASYSTVPTCGDAAHALAFNGSAFACQMITSGNPPGGTNGQIQINSAGVFGGIAAPAGTVVGTTDTQTLTNKSIAGSEINSGAVGAAFGGTGADLHASTGIVRAGNPFTASELSGDASTSGSNVVTVLGINGVVYPPTAVVNQVPIITSTGPLTVSYESIVNCGDSSHALAYSTSTHAFSCQAITASAGTTTLDSIRAAGGANTIANGDNAQVWNWSLTTASKIAFTFGETAAASAPGEGLVSIQTLSGSTATPFQVTAGGNGIQVTTSGQLIKVGSGEINADHYNSFAVVRVVDGGTGDSTLTPHNVLVGEGTSAIGVVAGAVDTVLAGAGTSADPSFISIVNCGDSTHALAYSTTIHGFTCQTIAGSALAGGSNTQLQYNNSGALGGLADLTFNGTHTIALGTSGILDLHAAATSGFLLPGGLATGLVKVTTSTGAVSTAFASDIIANFSGCSGTFGLGADGACHSYASFTVFQTNASALSSSATVNFENSSATNGLTLTFSNPSAGNIQLGLTGTLTNAGLTNSSITITPPSWLTGGSVALGATLTISPTSAQTSHQVIGTCGTATTFTPCTLVAGDLPSALVYNSTANTGTSAMTLNLSASTTTNAFRVPVLAGATASASGTIVYDSTNNNLHVWSAGADSINAAFASAPTTGHCVQASVSAGAVLLVDSGSSNCGGGGSITWDAIGNPAGNQALAMAAHTTTWTWNAVTGSAVNLFVTTDTASNTGTGAIVRHTTASGSAAIPFQADANGTGWKVDPTGALISLSGGARLSGTSLGTLTLLNNSTITIESSGSASSTPWTFAFPINSGTSGYLLSTDGTGVTSWSQVNLATSIVTNSLPVAHGGTGNPTLTAHAVLLGEGTSAVAFSGPGATGTVLMGQGSSADPSFVSVGSCSGANQALTFNGSVFGCNTITGTGSGTVNTGTTGHLAYYATSTNAVSDMGADFTFATHTLAGGASAILDMHLASTSNFFLPGGLATGLVTVTTSTGAISSTPISSMTFGGTCNSAVTTTAGQSTIASSCTLGSGLILVFLNGVLLQSGSGNDYAVSGNNIVMDSTSYPSGLPAGQKIRIIE